MTYDAPLMYQFTITLLDSQPPIWRRFAVPIHVSLSDFHDLIQQVMGWHNTHDYWFDVGGVCYGTVVEVGAVSCGDPSTVTLADLALSADTRFRYAYDLEDGWWHILVLETIQADAAIADPICLAGERACPPEGAGGVWGYQELLLRLADTSDPEYLELLDWLGDFDAEAFDLDAVNQRLRQG